VKNKSQKQHLSLLIYLPLVWIPWDIEQYFIKCVKTRRKRDKAEFPDISLGRNSSPLTVVDCKGRIILWYLPGLLSASHRVSPTSSNNYQDLTFYKSALKKGAHGVAPLLRDSVEKKKNDGHMPNWRVYHRNFTRKGPSRYCEVGAVVFSAGWFAQGHAVCFQIYILAGSKSFSLVPRI
jgi:hypothetical protein